MYHILVLHHNGQKVVRHFCNVILKFQQLYVEPQCQNKTNAKTRHICTHKSIFMTVQNIIENTTPFF